MPYMSPGLPQRLRAQGCPGLGPGPDQGWDRAQGSPGNEATVGGLGSCVVCVCVIYIYTSIYICMNVYVDI